MSISEALFYLLSFLALLGAVMVVFSKNPVHSVLYLILTFFSLSGHYVLLNAQFLAAVNIIVYAGAIMVLFLFVIMFLNMKGQGESMAPLMARLAAVVAGGLLLVIMTGIIKDAEAVTNASTNLAGYNAGTGLVENLGQVLYTKYLVPFELASVLFLAAIVGAVLIGKREPGEPNTF